MANGVPDFDPSWWQSALGGIGALLIGWAGGRRRGRLGALDDDSAQTAVALEASRAENVAHHEKTRGELGNILDAMREEREAMVNLIRSEGRDNRAALYSLGNALNGRVEQLHRDMIDRTRGNGPRP